jgi:D-citramalate synthase
MEKRKIEIMDTTLRDGEQTSGVSFLLQKKQPLRNCYWKN